jgi:hypothetical protein
MQRGGQAGDNQSQLICSHARQPKGRIVEQAPTPMTVRGQYVLTRDDLAEALHGRSNIVARLRPVFFGWGLATLLVLMLVGGDVVGMSSDPWLILPRKTRPSFAESLSGVLRVSSLAVCAVFGVLLPAVWANIKKVPAPWSSRSTHDPVAIALSLAGIVALLLTLDRLRTPYERAITMMPVLALFMGYFLLGVIAALFLTKRSWQAQPLMGLPTAIEASSAGITFREQSATLNYQWHGILGFKEGPETLLLYPSLLSCQIIPKRAFATNEELDAFRRLLVEHVTEGNMKPSVTGFPITLPVPQSARNVEADGQSATASQPSAEGPERTVSRTREDRS